MQTHIPRPARTLIALAATSLGVAVAQGQEQSPYYIGVSQSVQYDNNVFRTSANQSTDTISRTGLTAGLDQRIGRQRVFADGDAEINRYRKNDSLDNKSYALRAGLDWETIETLSGSLRYSARNSLTDFGITEGTRVVSDQITQQFIASGRWGLPQSLSLDAGYEHRKLTYENVLLDGRNYSQDTVNVGIRRGTGRLTLGLGVRESRGSTPRYRVSPAPTEDELKRRDVDLTAAWAATGFSTFNARLSRTKETHSIATNAELSETTGALGWNYQLTGKLNLNSTLTRDTGTETTFLTTSPEGTTALPVDSNRLSTTLAVDARYTVTGKTSFSGNVRYRRGTRGDGGNERVTGYGLAIYYTPTRAVSLSCSVATEDRSAAGATGYRATLTGCAGDLTFR